VEKKPKEGVIREYWLIPGYAKARIERVGKTLIYKVIEPKITNKEIGEIEKIKKYIIEVMDADVELVEDNLEEYINKKFEEFKKRFKIKFDPEEEKLILYYLKRDFLGLEKIEPLMHDPNIEDISCDGLNIPIYISHRDFGSIKTNIVYKDLKELENFVIKLSQKCGRFISYGEPLLDGSLKNGARVNATFGAGVTVRGPTFDIRKFREIPFTPLDLIKLGTFNSLALAYLWIAIETRKNILICGGTASGKTTVLNAISLFIPENLKIVSIEDTAELNLLHENWIQSISRSGLASTGSGEKYGEVSMFDLLKASFRQRPDYVIVGEVRGKEATVMFQGMASGHSGLGTIHAESLDAVIERLSTPPINLPKSLIKILDILVLQISTPEIKENARRAKEIIEIMPSGRDIESKKIFRWKPKEDILEYLGGSKILEEYGMLKHKKGAVYKEVTDEDEKTLGEKEMFRRAEFLEEMLKKNITFSDFPVWIHMYQNNPDMAFKLLESESG